MIFRHNICNFETENRISRQFIAVRLAKLMKNREITKNKMTLTTQSTLIPRDDCSLVRLQCMPADYSASILTHACEDVGVPVVDLLTSPLDGSTISVTLRLRCEDPSPAVHNLERYGYEVTEAEGNSYADATIAYERLLELQTLLNV